MNLRPSGNESAFFLNSQYFNTTFATYFPQIYYPLRTLGCLCEFVIYETTEIASCLLNSRAPFCATKKAPAIQYALALWEAASGSKALTHFPEIETAAQLYLNNCVHLLGSWDNFRTQLLDNKWGDFLSSNFPIHIAPPSFADLACHPAITCLPYPIIHIGLYFAQICHLTESLAVFCFLYSFGFLAIGYDIAYLFPLLQRYLAPISNLLAETCSSCINDGPEATRIFTNVILTLVRPFAGFPCGLGPAKSLPERVHPAEYRKPGSFLALNNLLGQDFWLDRLNTVNLQGLELLPEDIRELLLEEASILLQPTALLCFALEFSKNHAIKELFDFKEKGQASQLAQRLRASCPYCFNLEFSSSKNWVFALGLECLNQARILSINASQLCSSLITTFPKTQLSFEPTPFGIHIAIQAAITHLHFGPNPNLGYALLPPHIPIGAAPPKRVCLTPRDQATSSTTPNTHFSPAVLRPPIGSTILGIRRAVEPDNEQAPRAHLRPRTTESLGLETRISVLLQADPELQETLATFSRERVQFLFDLACISNSPIETIWQYIQKVD